MNIDMQNKSANPLAATNPIHRYGYIDTAFVLVRDHIENGTLNSLSVVNGARVSSLRDENGHEVHPNNYQYKQIILIQRPKQFACEFFDSLQGSLLCGVHFSIDLIFDDYFHKQAAEELFRKHAVKLYHRDQGIRIYEGTWYTGHKGPHRQVLYEYSDKVCRIDKSPHCVHIEYALTKRSVVTGYGIETCCDLLGCNQLEFWLKNLLFKRINLEKLGFQYRKHVSGLSRKRPWISGARKIGYKGYNHDRRLGGYLSYGLGTQEFLDQCREDKFLRVIPPSRFVETIDGSHLIPHTYI